MRTVCCDSAADLSRGFGRGEGALVGGFLDSLLTRRRGWGRCLHLVVLRLGYAGLFRSAQGKFFRHQVRGVGRDNAVANAQAHDLIDRLLVWVRSGGSG